jgi:N-acyl homoserine lactone hydrolase
MKMHVLSGGRLRVRKTMYDANAVHGETFDLPVSCILLRHHQGNVLFDTGCHPAVAEDAQAHWGALVRIMTPVMPPGDNVITALAAIGLNCDDIDVVVCSHLHVDHCGCNAFFKRATVVLHAKEAEAALAPGAEAVGYLASEWQTSAPTDVIDGERDLFGDGRWC